MNLLIALSSLLCLAFLAGALFLWYNARYEVRSISASRCRDPEVLRRKIENLAGGIMLRLVADWWTRQMAQCLRADAALQARVLASAAQHSVFSQEQLEQQFRSRFALLAAQRLLTNYPSPLFIQAGAEVTSGFLVDVLAPICAYEPALFPTRRMTVKRDWVRLSLGGGSGSLVYRRGYYRLRCPA